VSVDIIDETPKKKPPSPWSFSEEVVKCLSIVAPLGRIDAVELSN